MGQPITEGPDHDTNAEVHELISISNTDDEILKRPSCLGDSAGRQKVFKLKRLFKVILPRALAILQQCDDICLRCAVYLLQDLCHCIVFAHMFPDYFIQVDQ